VSGVTASLRRSARVDHALRALLALDGSSAGEPCKLAELTARSPGPQKFLAMILAELRQGGIVDSTRGSRGGYWLARPLAEITVLQVVEALGRGAGAEPGAGAVDPGDGFSTAFWGAIDDRVSGFLATLSLADLALGKLDGQAAPHA
jgi:Rrf2 family protein